jgi:hypothetical protein
MLVPKKMWYYDSCQLDAPKITKANITIQMEYIYIYISTQHMDRIGFSCTISQENIPINKYSNILTSTKT